MSKLERGRGLWVNRLSGDKKKSKIVSLQMTGKSMNDKYALGQHWVKLSITSAGNVSAHHAHLDRTLDRRSFIREVLTGRL